MYAGAAAGDPRAGARPSGYLVPRADGVVVGATQYEHGRDTAPAVTGVRELLDDACAVVPALGEYDSPNAQRVCGR